MVLGSTVVKQIFNEVRGEWASPALFFQLRLCGLQRLLLPQRASTCSLSASVLASWLLSLLKAQRRHSNGDKIRLHKARYT